MDSGYYAALAGLQARTQALELLAHNLANLNTKGYRAQREFYRSLTASLDGAPLDPLNRAINNFGVLGGAMIDLRPGNLEPTGNPLDLAIEGSGFFAVETPAGIRYTRNGSFRVSASQRLVAAGDHPVLGEQGPIEIPSGAVSISPDGTLSVGGAVIGRLRMVEFAPGAELTPEGDSFYAAPAGAERPAASSAVRQGAVESSNFNPVAGTVGLVVLQRHAEMLQRTLAIFHGEFNRMAAEELPRI